MLSDVNHVPKNKEDDFIFDVNRSPDIIKATPHNGVKNRRPK